MCSCLMGHKAVDCVDVPRIVYFLAALFQSEVLVGSSQLQASPLLQGQAGNQAQSKRPSTCPTVR